MNTLFTCYRCKGHFQGDNAFDEHVRFSGCYASKPTKQVFSVRALAPDGVTHILEVRNVHTEGDVTVVETFLSALPPGRGMVPMTAKDIKSGMDADPGALQRGTLTAFCRGVRFAEKFHGIKEGS